MEEYYKIHEVKAEKLALVFYFMAVITLLAGIVIGVVLARLTADFTMTDAQAKAYCAEPVNVYLDGAQEDELFILPADQGRVDFIRLN